MEYDETCIKEIYHEKQKLLYCAVHAINNLFQSPKLCSKAKLDEISYNLNPSRWNNPHKSNFGFGNYDVNVITSFIQHNQHDIIWFDKRRSAKDIDVNNIFGFLLNSISKQSIFGKSISISSNLKHWYVVRKLAEGCYYNLDSKLAHPVKIGRSENLIEFLNEKLSEGDCQLLLVVNSVQTSDSVYLS